MYVCFYFYIIWICLGIRKNFIVQGNLPFLTVHMTVKALNLESSVTGGLLWCFISCLDSHSNGTHSLQRVIFLNKLHFFGDLFFEMDWGTYEGEEQLYQTLTQYIYIYIYAFSRCFLSDLQCIQAIHFLISMCSLGIEPTTQYSTTEPQEHTYIKQ